MAGVENMLIGMPEYLQNANLVKDLVLEQMYKDGVITEEVFEKYRDKQIIIFKRSWFKRIFTDDAWVYKYVDLK